MRITLGVELVAQEHATPAPVETLLERLRFPDVTLDLVHVVPRNELLAWGMEPAPAAQALAALTEQGAHTARAVLAQRGAAWSGMVAHWETTVVFGEPAHELLRRAEQTGADLIAVSATRGGPLVAALVGSVARALALGARQSVLIGKPSVLGATTPMRAVLATDHSAYAECCLEKFLQAPPQGLAELIVVTAYDERPFRFTPGSIRDEVTGALVKTLEEKVDAVAQRLRAVFEPLGTRISTTVRPGPIRKALGEVMSQQEAELLILGAKGHNLWERLTLGSVSLDQAMGSYPYSVLLLRA